MSAGRILALVAAAAVAVALLPPRCADRARAADAAVELEPIDVTPLYVYSADRQWLRLGRQIPELGSADALPTDLLEQLSDFFVARADPNDLPARQIEWLTAGH